MVERRIIDFPFQYTARLSRLQLGHDFQFLSLDWFEVDTVVAVLADSEGRMMFYLFPLSVLRLVIEHP